MNLSTILHHVHRHTVQRAVDSVRLGFVSPVRSPHWPAARRLHLKTQPNCVACGTADKVQVHHIQPYHLHPSLELDQANMVTLCENPEANECHLKIGHRGNFKNENKDVLADIQQFKQTGKLPP